MNRISGRSRSRGRSRSWSRIRSRKRASPGAGTGVWLEQGREKGQGAGVGPGTEAGAGAEVAGLEPMLLYHSILVLPSPGEGRGVECDDGGGQGGAGQVPGHHEETGVKVR